jgi:hypothetical protein
MGSRRLSAPRFGLEFLDLFGGGCLGQRVVKLFTSLPAKSLQVGNLGPGHGFLPGDPLLGWFFRVWSGFGVHVCKFATGQGEGLTQSSKWLHDTLGNRLLAGSPIKRNPHLQRGLSVLTALNCFGCDNRIPCADSEVAKKSVATPPASMNAAGWIVTAVGVSLLGLVSLDVYFTILHSRGRSGPVTEMLIRVVWRLARGAAFRRSRQGRHRLLNHVGPLLLPGTVATLVGLIITGYALLYFPHLPQDFNVEEKARSPRAVEAFYFSGITFTTLGYGDISPRSTPMRLLALSEALTGFGFISLAVAYLVSLTAALERKRIVALSFYHQARQGADVAGLLIHHFVGGRFVGLDRIFAEAARDLQALLESHFEHPLVHYFHPPQVHKSLPRMLFLVLEVCAVTRACLDREAYDQLCQHPELRTLEETARHVLSELATAVGVGRGTAIAEDEPGREGVPTLEEPARWRQRYEDTLRQLKGATVRPPSDPEAGWREYRRRRHGWELELASFALYLGYDWDEVTGDGGLRVAAD